MAKILSGPLKLRNITDQDYPALLKLNGLCRPNGTYWREEQFLEQLKIFSKGQLCIEYQGEIVVASNSLLVKYDHYTDWNNAKLVSDNGYIRNHDPKGDTLCCIDLMVAPKLSDLSLEKRIYKSLKKLATVLNVKKIIIAGPTPGHQKNASDLSEEEYLKQVSKKKIEDPIAKIQFSSGFSITKPHYLADKRGGRVWLEWTNSDYEEDYDEFMSEPTQVRICVVQYKMRKISSFEEFVTQCEFFVDTAADYKSDFVLFPELFTTQLLSLIEPVDSQLAAKKLAEYTPRYKEMFTQMALKHDVNIIGGSQFEIVGDHLYNIAYLFRRNGTIDQQYKIHVTPNERRWWGVSPGNKVEVFETDRGKIAIAICYDIEFPELVRVAVAKGANIIFVPFNTDERYGYLRVRNCAMARAIENQIYVAISGCTGNLPQVENTGIHYAQSGIFTPCDFPFARDGIASETNPNTETLIIHDVELDLLHKSRLAGTTQNWNDRRTDLFEVVYKGT